MRLAIDGLNAQFEIDLRAAEDKFNAELLIQINQLTIWRDHQISVYREEADAYIISEKLIIDAHVELTIKDYNMVARVTIQEAHVRIQTETNVAISGLELEFSLQVKAIADRIREINNPQLVGWDQRAGYCRRTYGSYFETKDIRKGAANSNAEDCSKECEGASDCYAFFLGNDKTCNMWVNKDISEEGEDTSNGCFHLNNCYVRLNGQGGKLDVDFAMGGSSVPAGFRSVCLAELSDDVKLWRAAKEHMSQVSVDGGYLNRRGQYIERRSGAAEAGSSTLYVAEDYPMNSKSAVSC